MADILVLATHSQRAGIHITKHDDTNAVYRHLVDVLISLNFDEDLPKNLDEVSEFINECDIDLHYTTEILEV